MNDKLAKELLDKISLMEDILKILSTQSIVNVNVNDCLQKLRMLDIHQINTILDEIVLKAYESKKVKAAHVLVRADASE